jgi:hypothetical protein
MTFEMSMGPSSTPRPMIAGIDGSVSMSPWPGQ